MNQLRPETVAQVQKAFYAGLSVRRGALFAGANRNTVQRYYAQLRAGRVDPVSPQAFGASAADTAIADHGLQGGPASAADGGVRSRPIGSPREECLENFSATFDAIVGRHEFYYWPFKLNYRPKLSRVSSREVTLNYHLERIDALAAATEV